MRALWKSFMLCALASIPPMGPELVVTERANHAMRLIESRLWLGRWTWRLLP